MGYFSCYPNKSFVSGEFHESKDDCKQSGLSELSVSMNTPKGEVVLVGCSHTGVEQIVSETKKYTQYPIEMVYGGFHMLPFNREQTTGLADQLKNTLEVHKVAPAHCTGHLASKILKDLYGDNYIYAGLGETIYY
ncbi:MAG TPA: hypothetical protein PLP34_06455 [Chitinophagaceae bacterium]|nr:hypothetical protein [Chitinophagaceae bacterium]HNF72033.1 hypothetical protein [Chitinophagaceae bacterium]